jgi:hypothetical protein
MGKRKSKQREQTNAEWLDQLRHGANWLATDLLDRDPKASRVFARVEEALDAGFVAHARCEALQKEVQELRAEIARLKSPRRKHGRNRSG